MTLITTDDINVWLDSEVPETDIELLDDKDTMSAYIPIWIIESLLDYLSFNKWDRRNHKYSFHPDHSGGEWLATSIELEITYAGMTRTLICSSFINTSSYPENKNILQTGIAEATKSGVKILGRRFGKCLNERAVMKKKVARVAIKVKPDSKVMATYLNAIQNKDTEKIATILKIYDIKTD